MKTTNNQDIVLLALAIGAFTLGGIESSEAQILVYTEDFETDHSLDGTWVANSVGGYNPVNLFFDYSTVGIPAAPNSAGGSTRGLKLQANLNSLLQQFPSGSSASPAGFNIPTHFEMRWDWWINFNGPFPAGGSGSTQVGGGGFGTAATTAQVAGAPIDSILVASTGEPTGSAADYRVYAPAFQASFQDLSGVYAASNPGARNNVNAYYQATFPPVFAPAAQVALYPQQTGLTQGGSAGMAWHQVALKKSGNIVTYTIDGLRIATIDLSVCGTLGGDKLVFSHFDINGNASTDPNAPALAFSLVDNVRVIDPCQGDIELPTIAIPADITLPATSPAGAVAYYFVTATDNCPEPVAVECAPVSGSTFPIGLNTVLCLAEDAAGNIAMSSFTVTVKGAAEQITDLTALVESLSLAPAMANSLLVKLRDAGALLSRGNEQGACGRLKDFIAEVSALAGKSQLPQYQADVLMQEASRIRAVLACKN